MSFIPNNLDLKFFDGVIVTLVQGVVLTRSIPATAGFAVCRFAGSFFADEEKYNPILIQNRKIVHEGEGLFANRFIKGCTFIASIGVTTAVSHRLYNYFSSIYPKALILGWHSMTVLDSAGLLEGCWGAREDVFGWSDRPFYGLKSMSDEQRATCTAIGRLVPVFFYAMSIWFISLGYHPIHATTSGWVNAAIASVITMRMYYACHKLYLRFSQTS